MLMACVMVFSVSGVCEALTLRRVSDKVQSKPAQSTFEITFSVGLKSPTIAYNSARERISDHNTVADQIRIDRDGYRVTDIPGSTAEYRNSTAATALTVSPGDLVVGPRPEYHDNSSGVDLPSTQLSTVSTGNRYVDTGRNVFDSEGKAVYIRTGGGNRYNNNGTPDDTSDDTAASPWKYERAKADPDVPIAEADRFDFNEETVSITLTDGTAPITGGVTIRDKRDNQPVIPSNTADTATTAIV